MSKLDKETLKGFGYIEAEIYNALDTDDLKRLQNIDRRLDKLGQLVAECKEDLRAIHPTT